MSKSTPAKTARKIKATAKHKLTSISKELVKNPTNTLAKEALEKWRKLL